MTDVIHEVKTVIEKKSVPRTRDNTKYVGGDKNKNTSSKHGKADLRKSVLSSFLRRNRIPFQAMYEANESRIS